MQPENITSDLDKKSNVTGKVIGSLSAVGGVWAFVKTADAVLPFMQKKNSNDQAQAKANEIAHLQDEVLHRGAATPIKKAHTLSLGNELLLQVSENKTLGQKLHEVEVSPYEKEHPILANFDKTTEVGAVIGSSLLAGTLAVGVLYTGLQKAANKLGL